MSTATETITPIVHLNGTSRQDLLDQRFAAFDALTEAGEVFAKAAPNARDYYPRGAEYVEAAQRQHDQRMDSLKAIMAGLQDELEALQE
jgi:hypothetical protein